MSIAKSLYQNTSRWFQLVITSDHCLFLFCLASAATVWLGWLFPVLAPVAWLGLVPFLVYLQKQRSLGSVFILGFLVGSVYLIPYLLPLTTLEHWNWSDTPIFSSHLPTVAWYSVLTACVLIFGGVFMGIYAIFVVLITRYSGMFPVVATLGWVLMELSRASILGGFTVGHIGYTQTYFYPIASWGAVGTVYLVGAIVLSINAWLAWIIFHTQKHYPVSFSIRVMVVYMIFVLGVGTMIGNSMLQSAETKPFTTHTIDLPFLTEQTKDVEAFEHIMSLLREALQKEPNIIVLPEYAFGFFTLNRRDSMPFGYQSSEKVRELYDRLTNLSVEYPDTVIFVGMQTAMKQTERYNSIVAYKGGSIVALYDKRHLLFFSEKPIPFVSRFEQVFVPGSKDQYITIEGVAFQLYICSEIYHLSKTTAENIDFVIHSSNELLYRSPLVMLYTENVATMRAIEARASLLRATKWSE